MAQVHLKAIIWTLILASAIYVGFKAVVPLLIDEYQFQDGMQTIARFASVNHDSGDKVRQAILKEAEKDDVPVQADDIKIEGSGEATFASICGLFRDPWT